MCAHMQDSGHTPEWAGPMVERTMRNGKRIYTSAFKAWLVEQSRVPGVSVSGLAVRHGVNANLLRHWMRLEHWGAPAPDLPHRGAECTKAHTRGLPPRRQGGLRGQVPADGGRHHRADQRTHCHGRRWKRQLVARRLRVAAPRPRHLKLRRPRLGQDGPWGHAYAGCMFGCGDPHGCLVAAGQWHAKGSDQLNGVPLRSAFHGGTLSAEDKSADLDLTDGCAGRALCQNNGMKQVTDPYRRATAEMRGYGVPGAKLKPRSSYAVAAQEVECARCMSELRRRLAAPRLAGTGFGAQL